MAKVLQVRDVPDDVHDARREQVVQDNVAVIRAAQADVRGQVDRRAALADGRGE